MILPGNLVESLKILLNCPDLQIFMKPQWGSQNPQHRALIREELVDVFQNSRHRTSISHCAGMGIVVAAPGSVGVDVELSSRVEDRLVARVSSQEELSAAPSSPSLWCAKEACFKALRPYAQPPVISQISIGAWKKIDSQTETYGLLNSEAFKSPSKNRGVVIHHDTHTYGFFIFSS